MKRSVLATNERRNKRRARSHAKMFGTATAPRLTVFRSNRYLYVQLIDDERGITVASASTRMPELKTGNKTAQAAKLGEAIATKAAALKVTKAVFDRGSYLYHGRVQAVAEAARKGGLKF